MTREEAKALLIDWKPPAAPPGGADPALQRALELAQSDPELRAWFEAHKAFQSAASRALRELPVPPDLAEQIVARRKIARPAFGGFGRLLAVAASLAILAVVVSLVFTGRSKPAATDRADFETFRNRMVRAAAREYRMDIITNDLAAIRNFLAQNKAPADFELPPSLAALPPAGAGLLSWQGDRVSMVCLQGNQGMLYLFITPTESLEDGGPPAPQSAEVATLSTVSWTRDNRAYVLASHAPLSPSVALP